MENHILTEPRPTKMAEKSNWTAVSIVPEEFPKVAAFFKKNYQGRGTYGTLELFRWKLLKNVNSQGKLNAVKDGEEIASTTSLTPKRIWIFEESHLGAEIGDTYTGVDYQRQGMFSLLINETRKYGTDSGMEAIYGTPNHQSLPGYEKNANFLVMPSLKVRTLYLPLNGTSILEMKFGKILGSVVGPLASIAARIASAGLSLLADLRAKSVKGLIIENIQSASGLFSVEGEWDIFWKKARSAYHFIPVRSLENFRWRFFENPNQYSIYLAKKEDEIYGYLVTRTVEDEREPVLVIADFLTLPEHTEILVPLLRTALSAGIRSNTLGVSIWCVEDSPYFSSFKKLGFVVRSSIPVIFYKNDFFDRLAKTCARWHFTVSDSDNI